MSYLIKQKTTKKISRGKTDCLGATVLDDGINFAVYSEYAQNVFLLLFNADGQPPSDIVKLYFGKAHIWSVFVEGVRPGQLYAYKVCGKYEPDKGLRFNEHKLLADPYAKAFSGKFVNTDNILLPYDALSPEKDMIKDNRDNTLLEPKCIAISDDFDWKGDVSPRIAFEELVIYEVHLKGFTVDPSSSCRTPGTYSGFIEKIPYLQDLGINAVELMPLHEFYIRDQLARNGLSEYWGYNSIGFFAPESSYSVGSYPGSQVNEFKNMVCELHKAGIEVILDVVYNHTGEGNELGPAISFKGIDNPTYYALSGDKDNPYRYYRNDSGCGNILNIENPVARKLVIDSLRYWVEVMHVDGFRFDLASILGRRNGIFSKAAEFFSDIKSDPILSKVKMIAEPWDLTAYEVGNFPGNWAEWNGRYRDTARKFLKGDGGQVGDLACRLTGSADLYSEHNRCPCYSVNFITCHDGFTLADVFSYNEKHNEANGENNADGANDNNSWNCGVEGNTSNKKIGRLRKKLVKNAFFMLMFSAGTPMILYGDEVMRSQKGNNNVYCQDNEISWMNWKDTDKNCDILSFCRNAINFRKAHPILRMKRFFTGMDIDGNNIPDVSWFNNRLKAPLWNDQDLRFLAYLLDGSEADKDADYKIFIILNSHYRRRTFSIPQIEGKKWYRVIDTSLEAPDDFLAQENAFLLPVQEKYIASERSFILLKTG